MGKWTAPTETRDIGGLHRIFASRYGQAPVEITFLRGIPVQLQDYGDADPFGDTNAQINLPQVTGFDDPSGSDLVDWFADYSDIDIWWWPATLVPRDSEPGLLVNPLTSYRELKLVPDDPRAEKVWEGFIANIGYNQGKASLQCQGAILQGDGHLAQPQYPARPIPNDDLFAAIFDNHTHPDLRTLPLRIDFPEGWSLVGPQFATDNLYTPNIDPGRTWTGWYTRATGSWEHAVTGWMQDQLGYMLTQDDSGVLPGDQWTVAHEREDATHRGRQPVLQVRARNRPADLEMWYGTPGLEENLQHDTTQGANVLYGDGTGVDGTVWRNAQISADGSRTTFLPLAYRPEVYPYQGNQAADRSQFVRETYVQFGTGMDQPLAVASGAQLLQREVDPGWAGTLTLKVDPSPTMSRWQIHAGMTFLLKGFRGGDIRLHIASKSANPSDGSVTLQVDDRYRDLITVSQAVERARDSLTPTRALQVNRASQVIEDIQAPWDYTAGSGFIPRTSTPSYKAMPPLDVFPHAAWLAEHPPTEQPQWYVPCHANAPTRAARWAGAIPVLMSEKGTIRRSEFVVVNGKGEIVPSRFHVSLYYVQVTPDAMPRDAQGPSPWIAGAFETINPATGQEWPDGNFLKPDDSYLIGWGNYQQPAGYSPGRYTDGAVPTGQLIDESTWTFDCTNNPNYNKLATPGQTQVENAIMVYAMFYMEWTEPVYFTGRLYRQPQGS